MEIIADILLAAGALGAGFYCFVLARRLKRFNDLEKGVGGAVAVLSAQVDDLSRTLDAARSVSQDTGSTLENLTGRAENVAQRLELMMASMHDVPAAAGPLRAETDDEPAGSQDVSPPEGAQAPQCPDALSQGAVFRRYDRNPPGDPE